VTPETTAAAKMKIKTIIFNGSALDHFGNTFDMTRNSLSLACYILEAN